MTDTEKAFALSKAKDITQEAWHVLCDRFMILEDMRRDDEKGAKTRSIATVYLLGVIAQALLSERDN